MADHSPQAVVITGVAGGIGQAAAQAFAAAGWQVVGLDRDARRESLSGVAHYLAADLASEGAVREAVAEAGRLAGRVDALVNNAALQICKPLVETTIEEWDATMAVNLRSVYLMCRFAYPLLKRQGGAIVNVSSVHAMATSANIAAYAASKGGVLALTRALAIELALDNIRVNALLPGAVNTPMLHAGLRRGAPPEAAVSDLLANLARRTVNGRVGQPEEIAQAILFLADGRRSSFMTGQALAVDGGATARLSTE